MRIVVLLFASLPDIAGGRRFELEVPDGIVLADLRQSLAERWPAFARVPYVFAVNRSYANDETAISDGDEVACVPAISGGSGAPGDTNVPPERVVLSLTRDRIDARAIEEAVRSDHDGALVTFHGVTRDHHGGRAVRELSYEAYDDMAIEVGRALLEEVVRDLEVGRLHVVHRLGRVSIGEASIVVVVAAAHRGPAFDAARLVMDRIKRELPIFKRETYEDDSHDWVGDLPQL